MTLKKLHIYIHYVCMWFKLCFGGLDNCAMCFLWPHSRCRNCAQFAHRCCLERRLLALDVGSADVGEWGIGRSLLLIPFPSSFSWQNCRTSSIWYHGSECDVDVSMSDMSQFIHGVSFIHKSILFDCAVCLIVLRRWILLRLTFQGWFVEPQSTQGIHISSSLSSNVTANSG